MTEEAENPRAVAGDNSGKTGLAKDILNSIVRRVENLNDQKAEIANDIKEVYTEAKSHGFDTKILRKVIAARKKSADERENEQAVFDLYLDSLDVMQ